jgi:hypothetical protein
MGLPARLSLSTVTKHLTLNQLDIKPFLGVNVKAGTE